MTRLAQSARILAQVESEMRGLYFDRLPIDMGEDKATDLWKLSCWAENAEPYVKTHNRAALTEAFERLGRAINGPAT